jgi:acetolactate synthase-1/2/3 large subunit
MVRVVDSLVEQLAHNGIDTYFIVSGGVISPFIDAVGLSQKAKYYCFQHEQAAAMAAEGYYRSSGKVAAVLVTSGPGAQNILNGVCGCWYDSIPALFVTGQVNTNESLESVKARPRQMGFQETPVVSIFSSCTLFSKKIERLEDVASTFSHALECVTRARLGPVHIDFPINIQFEKIDTELVISKQLAPCARDPLPSIDELVKNSKRPLVVIGSGARNCNIDQWIKVPCIASWGGFDVIKTGHPLMIGNHGIYGDRVSNFALQNADLIIILGSRMDNRQTGSNIKACSRASRKIMVDVDPEEIAKLTEKGFVIDVPIVNTVQNFISEYNVDIECQEWVDTIAMWKREFGPEPRDGNVYSFMENLELPDECIVIPDTGGNLVWTIQTLKLKEKQRLFTNLGNSSMGFSLPCAIGASIGRPGVPVISISGDGGIQMNIQELETVRHLNLPITIIVINNNGHGIIRQFQDSYFASRYTGSCSEDVYGTANGINLAAIAGAYGLKSARIGANETVDFSDAPRFYDVEIDPQQKVYPKMEFGTTLENMAPKRPELLKYMLI